MKSGNLNFLESTGPLQACNGTVLPSPLYIYIYIYIYIYLHVHTTNTLDMLDEGQLFSLFGIRLVLPCVNWVNITSKTESILFL